MAKEVLCITLAAVFVGIVMMANIGDPCNPADPYAYGLYAPHPSNCSQFLQCVHGRFEVRNCSPGLHWNTYNNSCDWPQLAGCIGNATTTTTTTPLPTPTEGPPTEETTYYTTDGYNTTYYTTEDGYNTTYYTTEDGYNTTYYPPTTLGDEDVIVGGRNHNYRNHRFY